MVSILLGHGAWSTGKQIPAERWGQGPRRRSLMLAEERSARCRVQVFGCPFRVQPERHRRSAWPPRRAGGRASGWCGRLYWLGLRLKRAAELGLSGDWQSKAQLGFTLIYHNTQTFTYGHPPANHCAEGVAP